MTHVLEGSLHRKCGGHYQAAVESVTLRVSGMAATVERGVLRCSACGDEHRTVEQREAAEQAAIAAVRAEHGLMTTRELKHLRERLALTHEQLGDLLYGVPRSVVEGWERGRYVQNPEADALLRSLDDRETLERRAAKAGVTLPIILPLEQVTPIPVVPAADLPPRAGGEATRLEVPAADAALAASGPPVPEPRADA
jgi:putative zinc finger/helix-turn-helix YgiT family protein